jgi:hypothetical protein
MGTRHCGVVTSTRVDAADAVVRFDRTALVTRIHEPDTAPAQVPLAAALGALEDVIAVGDGHLNVVPRVAQNVCDCFVGTAVAVFVRNLRQHVGDGIAYAWSVCHAIHPTHYRD